MERTAKEASDFYVRKISLIKEKISKLQEIIGEKRESLRGIEIRIYSLIQQQQQAQAQKTDEYISLSVVIRIIQSMLNKITNVLNKFFKEPGVM